MYSDNGTNFVGASNELKGFYTFINKRADTIFNALSYYGKPINWHFNSPHFGGIWESHIKLVKSHITRVIGSNILTFEEFCTMLTQIESIVNSRPISPLSNDPQDLSPLTPAHFLIGRPLTAIPEDDFTTTKEGHLSVYQRLQQTIQHFWKRWKRDYINNLQAQQKWRTSSGKQINKDMLVLLVDDDNPPNAWKMGRVNHVWPGSDNKIRVVSVKTPTTEVKRVINKVCMLPFYHDNDI